MPRSVSLTTLQGMLAQRTDVVYLVRLKVDHPDLSNPLRFVNDKVDHTDGSSNVWSAFPFQAVLPDDVEDTVPKAEVIVSNVSRDLTLAIRALSSRPSAVMDVVTDQAFDTVEVGPYEFDVLGYEASAAQIRLTVGPATDFLNAAFPKDRFLPSNAGS
jgi:hypothetical protein